MLRYLLATFLVLKTLRNLLTTCDYGVLSYWRSGNGTICGMTQTCCWRFVAGTVFLLASAISNETYITGCFCGLSQISLLSSFNFTTQKISYFPPHGFHPSGSTLTSVCAKCGRCIYMRNQKFRVANFSDTDANDTKYSESKYRTAF